MPAILDMWLSSQRPSCDSVRVRLTDGVRQMLIGTGLE